MSDELVLYHNPMSRGRIARWMLEEVGIEYRTVLIDFAKKEHKTPEFLAMNPMGKLPLIVHRGTVVTETAAICAYLADAFPAAGLSPALDDPKRGTYFRWLFFGAGCVEPAIVDRIFKRPPVDRPSTLGYGSYEDVMRALETAVTPGPFVLGERFSAADVYIASALGWGAMAKAIELSPTLAAYVGRARARPAAVRGAEKDAEIVAKANAAG